MLPIAFFILWNEECQKHIRIPLVVYILCCDASHYHYVIDNDVRKSFPTAMLILIAHVVRFMLHSIQRFDGQYLRHEYHQYQVIYYILSLSFFYWGLSSEQERKAFLKTWSISFINLHNGSLLPLGIVGVTCVRGMGVSHIIATSLIK